MTEIIITLPLPDKCLSPNARTHWRPKSIAIRKHRTWARLAAVAWLTNERESAPKWERVEITAIWFRKTGRPQHTIDQGNATGWLKSYEDGFQDAGVYGNDRGVKWADHEFRVDKDPRIELTIRCLDVKQITEQS